MRLFFALALLPHLLMAQTPAPASADSGRGPVIRGILLDRQNVFDVKETGFIPRLVNRFHITTRAPVIRREFLFRSGAPYDSAEVAETARNLRSLRIFRVVDIDSVTTDTGLVMRVRTGDGWSTKPEFHFRSSGGQVQYTLSLEENNLLGTATLASVRYRKDPDRSNVIFSFFQPRLLYGQVGLGLQFEDRSDGTLGFARLSRPFFSLASTTPSFTIQGETRSERILRFFGGNGVAQDTLERHRDFFQALTGWAIRASSSGYLRWGLQAQVGRDDFAPESFRGAFPRSTTGAVGAWLSWQHANYVVARGFTGFGLQEDVNLSSFLYTGFTVAPKAFGYQRDGVASSLVGHTGFNTRRSFTYFDFAANGLFSSAGLDSGSVAAAATVVWQPGARHLAVVHVSAASRAGGFPGEEFDLGLGIGPRAFPLHSFTGDRAFFATAEYRFTVLENFFKVLGLGTAAFVDHGGAWYHGTTPRSGWDVGVGIRIGPNRATEVDATRIDLARRFRSDPLAAGWVLVVGRGFAFSTSRLLGQ